MNPDYSHILYLDTEESVCDWPDKLGERVVVPQYDISKKSCKECIALVMAHNEVAFKSENLPANRIAANQIRTGTLSTNTITSGKISASQVSDHMDMPMWKVWAVCMTVSMFIWYLVMVVLWQVAR